MTTPPNGSPRRPGPLRDRMEVGLDRHRKPQKLIPPWLEEKAGIIAIATASLFVIVPVIFSLHGSEPQAPQAQLTLISGPLKSWIAGSSTHLESLSVTIKNVSGNRATGVHVTAIIHGSPVALTGPDTVEAGSIQIYTGGKDLNVTSSDEVKLDLQCSNCQSAAAAPPA